MYLVFMGVSGSGKSTYARLTADAFGLTYFEADDYHPEENISKMSAGTPLTDRDREVWIDQMCEAIVGGGADQAVVTCSALTPFVRSRLEAQLPKKPTYLYLDVPSETIRARMDQREGHFMPSSLLASQFEALSVPDDAIQISNQGEISDVFERLVKVVETLMVGSENHG
ncbi:MAG: gluconokinase, GntK/IdnK-type [Pseudomonadota bacterium]